MALDSSNGRSEAVIRMDELTFETTRFYGLAHDGLVQVEASYTPSQLEQKLREKHHRQRRSMQYVVGIVACVILVTTLIVYYAAAIAHPQYSYRVGKVRWFQPVVDEYLSRSASRVGQRASSLSMDSNQRCRNTAVGRDTITDDEGYVCRVDAVQADGCCPTAHGDAPSSPERFKCDECDASGCCASYEGCVSCCLSEDKTEVLEEALVSLRYSVDTTAMVMDKRVRFDLCMATCRVSSRNVDALHHYKSALHHCYTRNVDYRGGVP